MYANMHWYALHCSYTAISDEYVLPTNSIEVVTSLHCEIGNQKCAQEVLYF